MLVDRITAVVDDHWPSGGGNFCEGCDWTNSQGGTWPSHVAEQVAAELNLTEEWGVMGPRDTEPYPVFDFRASAEKTAAARHQLQIEAAVVSRLVSGWTTAEEKR